MAATGSLLAERRVHLPRRNVGTMMPFTDSCQAVVYLDIYEWDGPVRAENYARTFWRVLALVSVPGSFGDQVLPGIRRDEFLAHPVLATDVGAPAPRSAAEASGGCRG